jgi:ABC-type phosphate transport system substrate-binding protein
MLFSKDQPMRCSILVMLAGLAVASGALAEGSLKVIANPAVPVESVDSAQATQIFLKQVRTWSDGTRIEPIDLQADSPLRDEFYRKVTGRGPAQLRAYWARQAFTGMGFPPRQAASPEEAARLVQDTPGAIGYTLSQDETGSVKILLEPK